MKRLFLGIVILLSCFWVFACAPQSTKDPLVTQIVTFKHLRPGDLKEVIYPVMSFQGRFTVLLDEALEPSQRVMIRERESNIQKVLDLIHEIDVEQYTSLSQPPEVIESVSSAPQQESEMATASSQPFEVVGPIPFALVQDFKIVTAPYQLPEAADVVPPALVEASKVAIALNEAPEVVDIASPAVVEASKVVTTLSESPEISFASVQDSETVPALSSSSEAVDTVSASLEQATNMVSSGQSPEAVEVESSSQELNPKVLTKVEDDTGVRKYFYKVKYGTAESLAHTLNTIYHPGIPSDTLERALADEGTSEAVFIASDKEREDFPRFIPSDPQANSLIIVATPTQYEEIEELLKHIDARPLQVFLDMAIAEITLLDEEMLGIQELFLNQGQVTVGGETNSVESVTRTVFTEIGRSTEGFSYLISAPGRLSAILRTLISQNRARILSDPHIFVRNNTEAKINIGERIPIRKVTVSEGIITEDIEHEETGITLTVTPRINFEGSILLTIAQEVSEVGVESYGTTGAASFHTRNTETSLVVQDRTTILIGGLISRERRHSESGVPLLKDIPLFGRLFRASNTRTERQELIILITAQIMRGPEDEKASTEAILKDVKWWLQPDKLEEADSEKVKRMLRDILGKEKK